MFVLPLGWTVTSVLLRVFEAHRCEKPTSTVPIRRGYWWQTMLINDFGAMFARGTWQVHEAF